MGRPRANADVVETSARVLSAAEVEFGGKGYDRARLSDIAKRAGISRPSLLYHYRSKDVLYAAVVRSAFSRLGAAMVGALESEGEFLERIDRMVQLFGGFLAEHKHIATMFLREMLDGHGPGRELLLSACEPILDRVEAFAKSQNEHSDNDGVPVRAALMQIVSGMIVHASAGSLRKPLWGDEVDYSRSLAKIIIEGN